jgi:hypothetical protein
MPGCAFAMYTDFNHLTVNFMGFKLAHVVSNIIDLVQVPVLDFARQHRFEGLAGVVR